MKKVLELLVICVFAFSCLKNEKIKTSFTSYVPIQSNDGWLVSTPEKESMNTQLLTKAYEVLHSDKRYIMAQSLIVIRNGKIVAEAYPSKNKNDKGINNIQSCTKSFTSILTGIAIKNGLISSLDEKLYSIYPSYFNHTIEKRNITIKECLTMKTGLAFDNSENTLALYTTSKNTASFVLSFPLEYQPGSVTNYNDGSPQLVAKVIESKSAVTLENYAKKHLFDPLAISNYKWEKAKDGSNFGAFGLYLNPRDFSKIGQLLLRKGKWEATQIIDSTYLNEATTTQTTGNFNNAPYGYYFWILPSLNGYMMEGHGGQFLAIIPDKELVICYTAWPYTSSLLFDNPTTLIELIVSSCH